MSQDNELRLKLQYGTDRTDDWTRTQDKELRKRIQNRLAQRKRRANVQVLRNPRGQGSSNVYGSLASDSSESATTTMALAATPAYSGSSALSNLDEQTSTNLLVLSCAGLAEHRIIRLSQYSFVRAMLQNAEMLGIRPDSLADDDTISPLSMHNPVPLSCPKSLAPTALQRSIYHHPYLDVIASAELRDNVLLAQLDDEQEETFCRHLAQGVRIWGKQAWEPMGWEMSEEFLTKWGAIAGAETIRFSNFWRGERGETLFNLDRVLGIV